MHGASTGNLLGFYLNQNLLSAIYRVAGTNNFSTAVTYNPAVHVYFRIRESGGTTFWETSPNGHAWAAFFSVADPIAVTSLFVAPIDVGTYNIEATATTAILDNINVVPALPPVPGPATGRRSPPHAQSSARAHGRKAASPRRSSPRRARRSSRSRSASGMSRPAAR